MSFNNHKLFIAHANKRSNMRPGVIILMVEVWSMVLISSVEDVQSGFTVKAKLVGDKTATRHVHIPKHQQLNSRQGDHYVDKTKDNIRPAVITDNGSGQPVIHRVENMRCDYYCPDGYIQDIDPATQNTYCECPPGWTDTLYNDGPFSCVPDLKSGPKLRLRLFTGKNYTGYHQDIDIDERCTIGFGNYFRTGIGERLDKQIPQSFSIVINKAKVCFGIWPFIINGQNDCALDKDLFRVQSSIPYFSDEFISSQSRLHGIKVLRWDSCI